MLSIKLIPKNPRIFKNIIILNLANDSKFIKCRWKIQLNEPLLYVPNTPHMIKPGQLTVPCKNSNKNNLTKKNYTAQLRM